MELEYGEKVESNIVQTKSLLEKYKNCGIKKIAKFVKPMSPSWVTVVSLKKISSNLG